MAPISLEDFRVRVEAFDGQSFETDAQCYPERSEGNGVTCKLLT